MAAEIRIVEEAKKPLGMNPKKFALWIFMVSVTMIFAAWTSAYLVRRADGNWAVFELPQLFWITSVIIVISSGTMHWAYLAAKRDNLEQTKLAISITTLLGVAFLIGQFMAWNELVRESVYFVGNPSGSFVYVISGVHGLHIVGGVVFLLIVLVAAFRYKVHSKKLSQIEMCATYWHFLDGLWLYLFVFLLLNR
ncbi:cytochrome c oxidase subunit 3 [Chryseolinea lacunae]|uniref:Cytochrome c oxidase subunit 3 n=1 Tax=Chryseolinea lacunae TaxID=2801331 RepID=A0ABS1KK60_9BACT|nr:cytochrome c oxidase subunit 3 [Chryseolinea lacunae]MBL0739748.1 cytochrome c oxidase subunit 3 [Chryseolinea lacunae]